MQYANDFGNNAQASGYVLGMYNLTLKAVGNATASSGALTGGVRAWVHCGAEYTPEFGSKGQVVATDAAGTFLDDVGALLDLARQNGVARVWLCLWNLAVPPTNELLGLVWDSSKLQSYLQVVLVPLLQRYASHPSLAGFDIVNEPEGSIAIASSSDPCTDTSFLSGSGAGWTGLQLPLIQVCSSSSFLSMAALLFCSFFFLIQFLFFD